jgi:hypothetical protein
MPIKRAAKVKELRPRTLSSKAEKRVKGGQEATKHPTKVTVPDLH